MTKKIFVNARNLEEYRVAIIEDGFLTSMTVSTSSREHCRGNIYKARVVSVQKSLQAVFIKFGAERNGFLPMKDIHPSYYSEGTESSEKRRWVRVEQAVETGQELLVQISREASEKKGAALTTYLSLTGRYLVLLPGIDKNGVSRKIEDAKERHRLRSIMEELQVPAGLGLILRTAGEGRNKSEFQRDLRYLLRLWDSLKKHALENPTPSLIYSEGDAAVSTIRDYFTPDVKEVLIDTRVTFDQVRNFTKQVMPRYARRIKLYDSDEPLFTRFHLEQQVEKMFSQRVDLKAGGHIVIEETEAMVTIDVNSGRFTKGTSMEDTAYQTNMEAVGEIVRQLKLRNLGGLLAIDFIDMRDRKHRLAVERLLKENLKSDKAKWDVTSINKLGVLVMSRQRLKSSLSETTFVTCPRCKGSGTVKSLSSLSLHILRKLRAETLRGEITEVKVVVHPVVAEFLLNEQRRELTSLESDRNISVKIIADAKLNYSESREEFVKAPSTSARTADKVKEPESERAGKKPEQGKKPNRSETDNKPKKRTMIERGKRRNRGRKPRSKRSPNKAGKGEEA